LLLDDLDKTTLTLVRLADSGWLGNDQTLLVCQNDSFDDSFQETQVERKRSLLQLLLLRVN
jgi:hypothetical protein